jgi:hypothetical protein
LGAAVAATAVIAVLGLQYWQAQLRPEQSFQIALVTIEDQSVFPRGERRTRGLSNPPQSVDGMRSESGTTASGYSGIAPQSSQTYFRDVDLPTALLQRAITAGTKDKRLLDHTELLSSLRSQGDTFDSRVRILIESTLVGHLAKPDERPFTRVRVYDLDDPRAASIRSKIKALQPDAHYILLTFKQ